MLGPGAAWEPISRTATEFQGPSLRCAAVAAKVASVAPAFNRAAQLAALEALKGTEPGSSANELETWDTQRVRDETCKAGEKNTKRNRESESESESESERDGDGDAQKCKDKQKTQSRSRPRPHCSHHCSGSPNGCNMSLASPKVPLAPSSPRLQLDSRACRITEPCFRLIVAPCRTAALRLEPSGFKKGTGRTT